MDIYEQLLIKGRKIFLSPDEEYPALEIISGVKIDGINGRMFAVGKETWRTLYRIDKSKFVPGPKELIEEFFNFNMAWILQNLMTIKEGDKQRFDQLCETVTDELKEQLKKNVKPERYECYNRVRKPVDLIFEHIVAMSTELREYRRILVPLLNVPLDKYVLRSNIIFNQKAKKDLGIEKREISMGDIKNLEHYNRIQTFIRNKASNLSNNYGNFYPIYFDLLWKDRYKSNGGNLFKTNPSKPKNKNRIHCF